MLYDFSPVFLSSKVETPHVNMRGVEIYVAPLVEALRIPTLLPPELFALGLEYLRSLAGLKVSPTRISLGAEEGDLVEAGAVEADIVLLLACWFVVLTTCVFMLYIFIFLSWINFLAMKMSKINQK